MRFDITYYMGPWPKALCSFFCIIAGGHLVAMLLGANFLSTGVLLGNSLAAVIVGIIAYRQKQAIKLSQKP